MVRSQYSCYANPPPSKIPVGKESHVISKIKPQIRIIHVYAPEIIKTDVENFRELVQRLTGKPSEKDLVRSCRSKSTTARSQDSLVLHPKSMADMEETNKFLYLQKEEEGKNHRYKEADMWRTPSSNNKKSITAGFFEGFSDLDSYVEELSDFSVLY